jgi:hypothetical protein
LKTEIKINNQSIFYEAIESELESDYLTLSEIQNPENKLKIYMITFLLDLPNIGLSKDCEKKIWNHIKKQFILFKKKYSEQLEKNFVIRVSYKYGGARFECEFDDLSNTDFDILHYANQFSKMYPKTKEIRILRKGPIIFRFYNDSQKNSYWNRIKQFINNIR